MVRHKFRAVVGFPDKHFSLAWEMDLPFAVQIGDEILLPVSAAYDERPGWTSLEKVTGAVFTVVSDWPRRWVREGDYLSILTELNHATLDMPGEVGLKETPELRRRIVEQLIADWSVNVAED